MSSPWLAKSGLWPLLFTSRRRRRLSRPGAPRAPARFGLYRSRCRRHQPNPRTFPARGGRFTPPGPRRAGPLAPRAQEERPTSHGISTSERQGGTGRPTRGRGPGPMSPDGRVPGARRAFEGRAFAQRRPGEPARARCGRAAAGGRIAMRPGRGDAAMGRDGRAEPPGAGGGPLGRARHGEAHKKPADSSAGWRAFRLWAKRGPPRRRFAASASGRAEPAARRGPSAAATERRAGPTTSRHYSGKSPSGGNAPSSRSYKFPARRTGRPCWASSTSTCSMVPR